MDENKECMVYKVDECIKNDKEMSLSEKEILRNDINLLDKDDHIELLRIIHSNMDGYPYTVSNRNILLNLNNLSEKCLWNLRYYINFCLENKNREQVINEANKEYEETMLEMNNNMKNKFKLKI